MTARMTSQEAERRYTSLILCGGTPDERAFALKRWMDAMRREWYAERSTQKRATAEAVR